MTVDDDRTDRVDAPEPNDAGPTSDDADTAADDATDDQPADDSGDEPASDNPPAGDATEPDDSDASAADATEPDDSAGSDEPDDSDASAGDATEPDDAASSDEPDDSDASAGDATEPEDSDASAADAAEPDDAASSDEPDGAASSDTPADDSSDEPTDDATVGPDDSTTSTGAPSVARAPSDDGAAATPEELADEIVRLRAEMAALQQQLDESTKPEPTKKRTHRSGRWWGSTICVVLGAILLPISVIGRWTATTLLDTDTYVSTVAPLADDEDIQEAVAFRVSETIVDVIDIEALVRDDLPRGTRFLAGPIESATRTLVDTVVEDFVSTDAFARFWADANRIGHEGVVAVFTGDSTDRVDAADGRVVLQVGPLVQGVIGELDDILGLDLADSIPDERLDGEFVIVDSDDLASVQGTVKLLDQLSVLIPILTLGLFAASIYLSRPRRIGWRNVGYAIVIPMALCVLLYTWVRGRYTDGLPDDIHNPDAAAAFFDITTRFLTRDLWVMLVIGVVILFVTWLFGPTGWAGRARAWWKALISKAGDKSAGSEVGEFPRWVARNKRGLLWMTFVLGLATLLLWTLPTGTVVLLIAVIVALVMIGIHILAEIGRKADSDIEADEDAADQAAEVEAAHADAARLEEADVS